MSILNKLGHCASWQTVISLDTSLAQLQLEDGSEKIPQGFSKQVPTILVWDNIDFGEETLSGRGTTHHTNGIMVQSRVSESRDTQIRASLPKRVYTFKPPPTEEMAPYFQQRRQGPTHIPNNMQIDLESHSYKLSVVPALRIELAYILLKYLDSSSGTIPGWTGFHTTLASNDIHDKSAIHYLPVIEDSPTNMSTVNTILKRSLSLADQLNLQTIVVVFDQAIYAKAQQIRWNDAILTQRVIMRLGEFHTCMCFLSVLGV